MITKRKEKEKEKGKKEKEKETEKEKKRNNEIPSKKVRYASSMMVTFWSGAR